MDIKTLTQDRLGLTKIYAFDKLTVISQKAINKQLAVMYRANKSLQQISLRLPGDDFAGLDAKLGLPSIELQLDTDNRAVYYFINITSGTLNYYQGFGPRSKQATLQVTDWKIALHVNLAFELADFKSLPAPVQEHLKVLGDYSVQQLLIDFTSANISNIDSRRSVIAIPSGNVFALSFWQVFMQEYLNELAKPESKNDSIIHYIPKANNTHVPYAIPTLPSTDFTFQNLPFVLSASDKGKISENSMLVYLEMTGGHPLPRELLPVSANWVVPSADQAATYDGTVVLSKGVFLDGWLLPNLQTFNQRSTWIATEAHWENGATIFNFLYRLNGHLGWWDATPSDVAWNPVDLEKVPEDVKNQAKTPLGSWYTYHKNSSKEDKHGPFNLSVSITGDTTNWCFIPEGFTSAGKAEITLMGSTTVSIYNHLDAVASSGWVKGSWKINLILDGVHEGELLIKSNPDTIVPIMSQGADEAIFHHGDVTRHFDSIKSGLAGLSMQDIVNSLTNALGGTWDFIFPGGQDFFIDKAAFNREQDLLCELKYKFKA